MCTNEKHKTMEVIMKLKEASKLLEIWRYAIDQGANVVLMRHAPKAGSNETELSKDGIQIARDYGEILSGLSPDFLEKVIFCRTDKLRTKDTLKAVFPFSSPKKYLHLPDLDSPKVSPEVQEQVNRLHDKIGRWRGYYLNHTYYFLEELGGRYDKEDLFSVVGIRMVDGIKKLFGYKRAVVYCGHSPSIEISCELLLDITLGELGGFLNPLDSVHLRKRKNGIEFIARINPIVDYMDLESEMFFNVL